MKTTDSIIGQQKLVIWISSEEKILKDKFDSVFRQLKTILQQNQQCQSKLETTKNTAINHVNSSMDNIIKW